MVVVVRSSPFGSQTRTRVLLALELIGDAYPRELARALGSQLSPVQRALRSLERDRLVAGRTLGRVRLYRIDPTYVAVAELRRLLRRLADGDEALQNSRASAIDALDQRPPMSL
jgi:DNA-binding transcriptional ArsR family regulator